MKVNKIISVSLCDTCPYNSGWDPDDCQQDNHETTFCAFKRITQGTGPDRHVGCMDRAKMTGKVPFPKWCPLPYRTKICSKL